MPWFALTLPNRVLLGPCETMSELQEELNEYAWDKEERDFKNACAFQGEVIEPGLLRGERPISRKRQPGNLDNFIRSECQLRCRECGTPAIMMGVSQQTAEDSREMQTSQVDIPVCRLCDKRPSQTTEPITVSGRSR